MGTMRERTPGSWELTVSAGLDPATGRYRPVIRKIKTTGKPCCFRTRGLRGLGGLIFSPEILAARLARHYAVQLVPAAAMVADELRPRQVPSLRGVSERNVSSLRQMA